MFSAGWPGDLPAGTWAFGHLGKAVTDLKIEVER